jgi:SAM-dependent methyltransferase
MSPVFDAYSAYYDLLYRDKDYVGEAAYIEKLLKRFAPNAQTVFEMGCGTGKHAELLHENGYTLHGIDVSEGMLKAAKKKAHEGLSFTYGDVRTYRAGCQFDAVISLFHVASYQTGKEDLRDYFATAADHLTDGGVFIFDFWYGPAVLAQKPQVREKRMEDDRIAVTRMCRPQHRESEHIVDVHYDVSVTEKASGARVDLAETHHMRYLFLPEVIDLAEAHDIEIVMSEEWMTGAKPTAGTWGVVAVGVKRGNGG